MEKCSSAVRSKKFRAAHPELNRAYNLRERQKFPEKHRARKKVEYAIKAGWLTKKPCERCGRTDLVHAHHDDYRRPLDVMWLCPVHHRARHLEIGAAPVPEFKPGRQYGDEFRVAGRFGPPNRTGFRGIKEARNGTFTAVLWRKGQVALRHGPFQSAEDAAHAYDALARSHYGEQARLNFPDGASFGRVPPSIQAELK